MTISNETFDLDTLAQRGRKALTDLGKGEGKSLDHWAELGFALRLGREQHADNKAFGKWKKGNIYSHVKTFTKPDANTEVAVMWLSAHPEQVAEVRKLKRNVYAPRKLHEAWKALVDEVLSEGDWSNDEQLLDAAADIGATREDIEAAQGRESNRRAKLAQALADEAEAEQIARDLAEIELQNRAQVLATELLEGMLARLPEELRAQVKAALSVEGHLIEAPKADKPKRVYRRKAKVEEAVVVEPSTVDHLDNIVVTGA